MTVGGNSPKAIDYLLGIDESGQYDTADIFGGIAIVWGDCRFNLYHEYGIFYAVEPHFFLLVPEANVKLCNVWLASPAGICPQTTYSPDAPDRPTVG